MKIKRVSMTENVGFNMTPMIDIVFQLIVFLMLATDIAQSDMAVVYLPMSSACAEDKEPDPDRLMVNVSHIQANGYADECPDWKFENGEIKKLCLNPDHWRLMVKGKTYDKKELEAVLTKAAALDQPGGPKTASNRPVMIRADAGAPFEYIAKILEAAGRSFIWKIEIGATKPPGSED
ncbi:MAG: biopolymer transporter ExbD [Candidatus Brocadiia bacterium]